MYHYDAEAALEELNEDALLPNPVHIRDMIIRSQLSAEQALELNRRMQNYFQAFGGAQTIARQILEEIAAAPRK